MTGEDSVRTQWDIDSVVTIYSVESDLFRQQRLHRYQRHKTTPIGQ